MFNVGYCDLCQKPAKQRCGGCHEIFYCSKEHQKSGWKGHKILCRPCKVAEDDTLGRFLLSTKSIKKGETVIKEHPLIYGPSQITIPICLGCGKPIDETNNHPCPKCGWPMCSEICQKNPSHLPECRYTVQRGDKVCIRNFGIINPFYQCVTVLRCLYQKQYLPDVWKKLDKLQSHCEDRKNTQKFKSERVQVAQFIRKFFKLDQVFTEDDIMRICGIIMVNSHEVPLAEPPFIAIYEMCSMFEHRCKANCSKSFTKDGGILLVAGEDIPKGDHLSICYTDPLWGTLNRRQHLYETKFFWCTCPRCSDVTEFGTYFSALKCQEENCDGNLLPKTFFQKMDNTKDSNWHCSKCGKNISYFSVHDLLEKLGSDLAELPKNDVNIIKQFLRSSSGYLHLNHFYLTEIRLALVQLIGQGNTSESMTEISEEDLELKAKTAIQLLSLFDSIAPAERRLKGIVLFELHASLAEMGRRNGEPDIVHRRLTEARGHLMDCIDTLKDEPSFLPEGQILKQAKQNLKNIDIVLQKILESVTSPT